MKFFQVNLNKKVRTVRNNKKMLVNSCPYGKLSSECKKIAKKLTFFSKELPKNVFFSKKLPLTIFLENNDNFWQFKKKSSFWQFFDIQMAIFRRVRCWVGESSVLHSIDWILILLKMMAAFIEWNIFYLTGYLYDSCLKMTNM